MSYLFIYLYGVWACIKEEEKRYGRKKTSLINLATSLEKKKNWIKYSERQTTEPKGKVEGRMPIAIPIATIRLINGDTVETHPPNSSAHRRQKPFTPLLRACVCVYNTIYIYSIFDVLLSHTTGAFSHSTNTQERMRETIFPLSYFCPTKMKLLTQFFWFI